MSITVTIIIIVVVVVLLLFAATQFRNRTRAAKAGRHRRKSTILHERADQQRAEAKEEEARARKLDPGRR